MKIFKRGKKLHGPSQEVTADDYAAHRSSRSSRVVTFLGKEERFPTLLQSCSNQKFFGGLLILLGLGTRLVSLPLAFTMVVAILTAKRANIDGISSLLGFEEWSYLVFFIWIALAGAGPISLDALITRLRKRGDAPLPKPLLRPRSETP